MNKKVVFLPYDMDTALGINNEGELVYGYSLEDTDHVGNDEVYTGQNSVLWNNLRDCFGAELQTMYRQLRSSGALSYAKVEKAFEDHQAVWPAAIFNEDAYFKYLAPWFDDNDKSYLRMLLGSKAEQRKWWLYNRFRYIDSKYNAGDALTDFIMLRIYNNSSITITPYADVYINIAWGSLRSKRRATRNTAYTIPCLIPEPNDQEVAIYSASQLADLGDMSDLKVGYGDFSKAIRLSRLILGSDANGYSNTSLRFLNIGALKLLQKIDCRNCVSLGTEGNNYAAQKNVDLKDCTGIEEVYFDGTSIASVTLPEGGSLKKLHLPGTVTNITIKNQPGVTEFVCPDYSHVTTVNLENSLTKAQVETIIQNVQLGCQIRLFNYRWDFESISAVNLFLAEFDGMHGIDQSNEFQETPQLFFTAHVPTATGDQIDTIHQNYPDVTIDADVASYYVKYYNEDGTTLLYTETVNKNQNGTWATQPTKAADAQYTYTFAGWSTMRNQTSGQANARDNITGNRSVFAAYSRVVNTYTVTFENSDGTVLQTVPNVPYGGTATYTGATPVHPTAPDTNLFQGWSPSGSNITGNTTCVANYKDLSSMTRGTIEKTITKAEHETVDYIRAYVFSSCDSLSEIYFPSVTSIGVGVFQNCYRLTAVSMPLLNEIAPYAFNGCFALTTISFPSVTLISDTAFSDCRALHDAYFPMVSTIGRSAFAVCNVLTCASFPMAQLIGQGAFAYCYGLASISFPIASKIDYAAFFSCTGLISAIFPEVTIIGSNAFGYCAGLTIASFPKANIIGNSAFQQCSNLVSVILGSSTVASLTNSNAFAGASSGLMIYVPDDLVTAYRSANNWSFYSSSIKSLTEYNNV